MTRHTVDALASAPRGLTDRGAHVLKGKSASIELYALDTTTAPAC